MTKEEFIKELKKINIELTEEQLIQLEKYYKLLETRNKTYNLTRIIEKDEVYLKHFYDSLTISTITDFNNKKLIDIGSGAGFPGIVIKIVFPNLDITLIDSVGKKVDFLNEVIKELNLTNIKALSVRAEEYQEDVRETFDIVTARAVAPLNILLELSSPFLKPDGLLISQKGSKGLEELGLAKTAVEKLNLKVWEIKELELPFEQSKRTVIAFKKLGKLNQKFPRNYSQIKKKAL